MLLVDFSCCIPKVNLIEQIFCSENPISSFAYCRHLSANHVKLKSLAAHNMNNAISQPFRLNEFTCLSKKHMVAACLVACRLFWFYQPKKKQFGWFLRICIVRP